MAMRQALYSLSGTPHKSDKTCRSKAEAEEEKWVHTFGRFPDVAAGGIYLLTRRGAHPGAMRLRLRLRQV